MSRAIELATKLEDGYGWALQEVAAAELRRLDAENAQLRADANKCGAGAGCCYQAARIEQLEAELEAIYSAVPVAWIRGSGLEMLKPENGGHATVYASEGMSNHSTPLIPLPERKS